MPLVYYEIHDVQDLYGAPIMSGIYDGNEITLPISSVQPPTPVGLSAARSPSTGTDFKVYVLDYWP